MISRLRDDENIWGGEGTKETGTIEFQVSRNHEETTLARAPEVWTYHMLHSSVSRASSGMFCGLMDGLEKRFSRHKDVRFENCE